jgi:hypothetical protein
MATVKLLSAIADAEVVKAPRGFREMTDGDPPNRRENDAPRPAQKECNLSARETRSWTITR